MLYLNADMGRRNCSRVCLPMYPHLFRRKNACSSHNKNNYIGGMGGLVALSHQLFLSFSASAHLVDFRSFTMRLLCFYSSFAMGYNNNIFFFPFFHSATSLPDM